MTQTQAYRPRSLLAQGAPPSTAMPPLSSNTDWLTPRPSAQDGYGQQSEGQIASV